MMIKLATQKQKDPFKVTPDDETFAVELVRLLSATYPDFAKAPEPVLRLLTEIAQAGSLPVERELLLSLRQSPPAIVAPVVLALAKKYDGNDHFYRAALNIACGTDPERRNAILADFDKHFPDWNDKVADLVRELRPASVLPRLGKLLEDPKLTP